MFNYNTAPHLPDTIKKKIDEAGIKKAIGPNTLSHTNKLLDEFNSFLNKYCGIYVYNEKYYTSKQYHIHLTLGNEDSLKTLVQSVAVQYRKVAMPHIITADYFDQIDYLEHLEKTKMIELTKAPLNVAGKLSAQILQKIIKKNTCIVLINSVDPIFGTSNDMKEISDICHKNRVPLHVNFNLKFGNENLKPAELGIDSFMFDFSNIGGVRGFGVLGISHNLYEGYGLQKLISSRNKDRIDPILLSMVNQEIHLLYSLRKKRLADIKRTHSELIKELKKKYNLVEFKDFIQKKNISTLKKNLVVANSIGGNILTIIPEVPINIKGDNYKTSILNAYSSIYNNLLKKNNLELNPFTRAIILSWGGYVSSKNFIKTLEKFY